ncbi:MAG: hypothetical protein P8Y44_05095, partial [Acidobacteriota bacterium]
MGDEFVIGTAEQGSFAGFPRTGVDVDGNFIVVWQEIDIPGLPDQDDSGITAQRRNIDGEPIGAQFQVNTTIEDRQKYPDVAVAPAGDFIVVWTDIDTAIFPPEGEIVAQLFDAEGQAVGGEFFVNSYTTGDQIFPRVAADGDGNFVVVWESDGSPGTDSVSESIQGRRISAMGTLDPQFQVNSYTTNRQLEPAIASAPDGNFYVTWRSF